mmetsp:Transcript_12881/g.26102  ORF Transcript_12881/g.26102 Transcript_12881/m.26102 type:complete len:84 (-) Transcript_12881:47-298(-)
MQRVKTSMDVTRQTTRDLLGAQTNKDNENKCNTKPDEEERMDQEAKKLYEDETITEQELHHLVQHVIAMELLDDPKESCLVIP